MQIVDPPLGFNVERLREAAADRRTAVKSAVESRDCVAIAAMTGRLAPPHARSRRPLARGSRSEAERRLNIPPARRALSQGD